jgi:hypothetical protein
LASLDGGKARSEGVSRSMDRDKTEEVIVTKADEDAIRDIKLQFNEAWDDTTRTAWSSRWPTCSVRHRRRRMD